jgi:acetylornithine deacetylase
MSTYDTLHDETIHLLQRLISIQSFSREENDTASAIEEFFQKHSIATFRSGNNVWARSARFEAHRPTLLLNSHHDTVRPNSDWVRDPFTPVVEDGILYGLGSNDAGGALCAMIAAFTALHDEDLPYNLILAATAEEEIAGTNGIEAILPKLGTVDAAIVGEPTGMQMAVAEKGLLVLDCTARGKSGHAARNTGVNAISAAMRDVEWFHSFHFPEESPMLGPVKMTVTQIQAGTQHNVIPDRCTFVVDVRVTDVYTHEEVLETIRQHTESEVTARSMRLRPSRIDDDHAIVTTARRLGIPTFGSPTMSDQALLPMPSVKMGPGMSERSHTADEFITLDELRNGVDTYITFLQALHL